MTNSPSTPTVIEPVRTSIVVATPREHAFTVFTERFDTWWPRSHYEGGGDLASVVLEPREGGRWYTNGTDGSVNEWGRVLVWEPPARIVLGWQLNTEYRYDPGLLTEVEVTFTELDPHRTLVELEHRRLERFAEAGARMRDAFDSDGGWAGLLGEFAATIEGRPSAGA